MTLYASDVHAPELKVNELYPLIDALGFDVDVGRKRGTLFPLTGGTTVEVKASLFGFVLSSPATIIESFCCPWSAQTTAVRVGVVGNLDLIFTLDHKRRRLEVFVCNNAKMAGQVLPDKAWSRLRFMEDIRHSVVAHYGWTDVGGSMYWQETPNGHQWVLDYVEARALHNLGADTALELADALAFGLLERTETVFTKWKISTNARRSEVLNGTRVTA